MTRTISSIRQLIDAGWGTVNLNAGTVIATANGRRAQIIYIKSNVWCFVRDDGQRGTMMKLRTWDRDCFPMQVLWEPDEHVHPDDLPHTSFTADGVPTRVAVEAEARAAGSAPALLGGAL